MPAVGCVELEVRVAPPGCPPRFTNREQHPAHIGGGERVRLVDAVEVELPTGERPHRVHGGSRPHGADALVKLPGPLTEVHATLVERRGALLEDDDAPFALVDRARGPVGPVVLERVVSVSYTHL